MQQFLYPVIVGSCLNLECFLVANSNSSFYGGSSLTQSRHTSTCACATRGFQTLFRPNTGPAFTYISLSTSSYFFKDPKPIPSPVYQFINFWVSRAPSSPWWWTSRPITRVTSPSNCVLTTTSGKTQNRIASTGGYLVRRLWGQSLDVF